MQSAGPEAFLTLADLRKSFGDLVAVKSLSLEVFRGEVFGFLGPNGAGKTTAIRMICGLLRADRGDIRLGGISLREDPRACRRLIGLCPQELVIWESLTCVEQLTFVGTQYDLSRREARRRSAELLDVLGLTAKTNRRARTLSGGMKRRLNLALALVHDPEILVLDEPQAGLDPQSRILVREYILSMAKEKTVLLTTHEMDEADRLAERIGIIDHGDLLVLDTPESLKERYAGGDVLELLVEADPHKLQAFLSSLGEEMRSLESLPGTLRLAGPNLHERIPGLLGGMREAGMEPTDLTIRKPTLEDVFISLTGRGLRE